MGSLAELAHGEKLRTQSLNHPTSLMCHEPKIRLCIIKHQTQNGLGRFYSERGPSEALKRSYKNMKNGTICLRVLSFIKQCLSSESNVVRYVTSYGLQYGCMSSINGKHIQFCCERFVRNQNDLLGKTFDKRHVYAASLNRRDTESYCRAAYLLKLLMVKRDILHIPHNFLNKS